MQKNGIAPSNAVLFLKVVCILYRLVIRIIRRAGPRPLGIGVDLVITRAHISAAALLLFVLFHANLLYLY